MAADDRYLSEAQLRAKYGDAGYDRRRRIGAFSVATPAPASGIPGLIPGNGNELSRALEEIAILNELQDAQAPENPGRRTGRQVIGFGPNGEKVLARRQFGPNGENVAVRLLGEGRRGPRGLDDQAQWDAERKEIARQAFLEAGKSDWSLPTEALEAAFGPGASRFATPHDALQAILGQEVKIDAAKRAQQYADILGIGPKAAYQLALADAGQADRPESLLRKVAASGEVFGDPVATAMAAGLNRELLMQRPTTADEYGSWGDAGEEVPMLRDSALEAVAERLQGRVSGQSNKPFRQLTAEETTAAAEAEGAGRTRGGRRNPLRKNTEFPEEAAVVRRPGNVLSAGMEFNPAQMLMPILVAPKTQQVWSEGAADLSPAERIMQVAQYNAGAGAGGKAKWRPSLRDARVLYVNPYAELDDDIIESAGIDRVPYQPEKDETGALDQKALNVPIPGVSGEGGFARPSDDPSFGMRDAQRFRNPTLAEAVQSLLLQHSTPIKPVTADMLVSGGRGYEDAIQLPDGRTVPVYALGRKRVDVVDPETGRTYQRPAPISEYFSAPGDPSAPLVADVRVGAPNKYKPEFYQALDALIGRLASKAYGGTGEFRAELAGNERFQPVAGSIPASDVQYGSLLNLAGNADISTVGAYQRALLEEAGFPVRGQARNPLMEMIGVLKDLGAAPPSDAPIRPAALTAAQAEPIIAPTGRVGAARALQQVKAERLSSPAAQKPTTNEYRQGVENAAQNLLGRLLQSGLSTQAREEQQRPYGVFRDDLAVAQPPYVQRPIPGLETEIRFPQTTAPDPVARDVLNYMATQNPPRPTAEPQRVVQFVPRELMGMIQREAPPPVVAEPGRQYIGYGSRDDVATSPWYVDADEPGAARAASDVVDQLSIPGASTGHGQGGATAEDPLSRLTRMMANRARIEGIGSAPEGAYSPWTSGRSTSKQLVMPSIQRELRRRGMA